ncbi:MAG: xanthine dehydrogenase family protein molybdopterin-binding subunit [Dehalococcoidia bacterium]|nr:xanthine dehydrogenase family protein molybdopterin-binding subunit [Dehalococcoidia bacterium]
MEPIERSVIGKRLPRIDGPAKAAGEALYTVDLAPPRMLWGKILRSPHPHARIVGIDTKKAERLPGVKAVVTGKDTLGVKYGLFPDEQGLTTDRVRFVGEGVAALAAVSEDAAEEALDLIRVEYEELPAVFDAEEAMKPGAPRVHDDVRDNVSVSPIFHWGDVEEGFKKSDYVREDTFRTQAQNHCTLEPHAALAVYDSSGKLTLWASTQGPYHLSLDLARTLGMPLGNVRVIKPHVGGGFGGKREMLDLHFCAALLSMKTGRPVKIVYTREEQFVAGRYRHPLLVTIKTGVKRDGTLLAKECVAIADGGAYNSRGPAIIAAAGSQIGSLYRVPNAKYNGYHVYTNKPVCGAFRGYGTLQVRFADDCQLDMIAEELSIDPVEIRLKNAIRPGEIAPCGWKITSCGFSECIREAASAAGWAQREVRSPGREGMGIGCNNYVSGSFQFGQPDSSGAQVKHHEDGTVTLFSGASDIGQGSDTTLAQIAAEELGVALEDIRISVSDTETTPTDLGSFASRVTFIAGNAVRAAAADAKTQLLQIAAGTLEAKPEDLVARDRRIYVRGSPDKAIAFSEAVATGLKRRGVHILGRGYYASGAEELDYSRALGNISPAYSFGAHVARVQVDLETGHVTVGRETAAHDCGVAINPMALEGQIEGSIVCGLGMTLMEDRLMAGGQVLNPSFESYKVPTALEAPEIASIMVETNDPEGPFGAKGVSEGAQVPVAPSVVNAVYEVTGRRLRELPITPERLLDALNIEP